MVQKSQTTTWDGAKTLVFFSVMNYQPQLVNGGFLNHQLYVGKYAISWLGSDFKHFLFSPLFGEMIQFDQYFSNGLKPPICWVFGFRIPFLTPWSFTDPSTTWNFFFFGFGVFGLGVREPLVVSYGPGSFFFFLGVLLLGIGEKKATVL